MVLFSFCLKDSFYNFLQGMSAGDEFSLILNVWKILYSAFVVNRFLFCWAKNFVKEFVVFLFWGEGEGCFFQYLNAVVLF